MTIQNAPPGLDYDRDKKFSKVLFFFLDRVTLKDALKDCKTYISGLCIGMQWSPASTVVAAMCFISLPE